MTMINSIKKSLRRFSRGQGLVEFTIMFPVLLIILSGMMEFGFMLNEYLDILDGAREAARFGADDNPFTDTYANRTFYYDQIAQLAETTMEPVTICEDPNPLDDTDPCWMDADRIVSGDVVISVFGVAQTSGGLSVTRFPNATGFSRYGIETSDFSTADVTNLLDPNAPNTGVVIVEVFYDYDQRFKLPWITAFVPDPIKVHSHTIMPAVAAEPTPTPIP